MEIPFGAIGLCYQYSSKTNNSWKLKLVILKRRHAEMLFETFHKKRSVYREAQKNSKTLRNVEVDFLMHFNTKRNGMNGLTTEKKCK